MSREQRYLEVVKKAGILGKELSVYGDSENPLFRSGEIAEWIGVSNVSEMVFNLEEGSEKVIDSIYTPGGVQKTWFLTEDGVYEILMTSRKKVAKEIRKGLKEFLKAWRKGEVKVVKKQMSQLDMIISMANIQKEIENRVETLEDKVNNRMTIESGKQNKLHMTIKKRVYNRFDSLVKGYLFYDRINDKTCTFDKKIKKSLFSSIHRELKNKFGVPSYRDIKEQDFESAIAFTESWREDQNTRDRINKEIGGLKHGKF